MISKHEKKGIYNSLANGNNTLRFVQAPYVFHNWMQPSDIYCFLKRLMNAYRRIIQMGELKQGCTKQVTCTIVQNLVTHVTWCNVQTEIKNNYFLFIMKYAEKHLSQ